MTPWELAKDSEHSHQRALFAWANCAANYGFIVANSEYGYNKEKREAAFPDLKYSPRPELKFLFAIHNQGHGDAIRGARAKAEGVKAGAPDLMLPVTNLRRNFDGSVISLFAGLFIEMKKPAMRPKREGMGGVKSVQTDFHKFLIEQDYAVSVCYDWQEAAQVITEYLR